MNPLVAKEKEDMYQVKNAKTRDDYKSASKSFSLQAQGFDEYISEHLVSLNRSLPDRRDDWCKNNVLVDPAYLPSTSVSFVIDIDGDGDDDDDGVK